MSNLLESPTPWRRDNGADVRAVESELPPAVTALVSTLGKALVAVIVERDVKTIGRWVSGNRPRGIEEQRRVRDTLQIVEILLAGDSPDVVRAWFKGMHPRLDDQNLAEPLSEGRFREIMAAARAYVNVV